MLTNILRTILRTKSRNMPEKGARRRSRMAGEKGVALVYMAVAMTAMLLFSGLAVDSGRAYVVKVQLTKAVDGAALAAARDLNTGDPAGEAARIFMANFPSGFLGVTSVTDPNTDPNFYSLSTDTALGINIITINAQAVLPTTFMKLAGLNQVTVVSGGQATRRMVDLSLVLDVSSSIGSGWGAVRDGAREFINAFDELHDRMAVLDFSNGATVLYPMPANRGFDKPGAMSAVPQSLPGGSTLMVEGLYRGWDELRSVPAGTQSSLRIIVLFTDGASNGVPGAYGSRTGGLYALAPISLRTADFTRLYCCGDTDPDGQTWNQPSIAGFFDPNGGAGYSGFADAGQNDAHPKQWDAHIVVDNAACLPTATLHTHYRSAGIPTSFALQTGALTVYGVPQNSARALKDASTTGATYISDGAGVLCPHIATDSMYPADVWNINNAARNVLEIIGDAARTDAGGDYPIHIFTIGMSYLVRDHLGTLHEMPEDILKRVANDPSSPDHNAAQLDGKYFYAPTAQDVEPAFQGIQNEILRLSR